LTQAVHASGYPYKEFSMKTPILIPVMTGLLALAGSGVAHAQD
jgi:hypothetical protein